MTVGAFVADTLDKASSPAKRAGHTAERAYKLRQAGVSDATIAQQMTDNSASGKKYEAAHVDVLCSVYEDAKTKVPLTKKATEALIKDQKSQAKNNAGSFPAGALPAGA